MGETCQHCHADIITSYLPSGALVIVDAEPISVVAIVDEPTRREPRLFPTAWKIHSCPTRSQT